MRSQEGTRQTRRKCISNFLFNPFCSYLIFVTTLHCVVFFYNILVFVKSCELLFEWWKALWLRTITMRECNQRVERWKLNYNEEFFISSYIPSRFNFTFIKHHKLSPCDSEKNDKTLKWEFTAKVNEKKRWKYVFSSSSHLTRRYSHSKSHENINLVKLLWVLVDVAFSTFPENKTHKFKIHEKGNLIWTEVFFLLILIDSLHFFLIFQQTKFSSRNSNRRRENFRKIYGIVAYIVFLQWLTWGYF